MVKRLLPHGGTESILPRRDVPFQGTKDFASIAAHEKVETAPKDDIESWFYLIIDLIYPKGGISFRVP